MSCDSTFCTLRFAFCLDSGFSLVEMIVAIAIFMIVAVIAVTALLKIVDSNRKSQSLQDTVNNINFVMDSMTRELRVGKYYNVDAYMYNSAGISSAKSGIFTNSNNPGGTSIVFLSSNQDQTSTCNLTYSYWFQPVSSGWTIEKAQQTNCGDVFGGFGYAATYYPILDPKIVITKYSITQNNPDATTNPNLQPSILMYISGYTGYSDGTKSYFDIQTTISQRT